MLSIDTYLFTFSTFCTLFLSLVWWKTQNRGSTVFAFLNTVFKSRKHCLRDYKNVKSQLLRVFSNFYSDLLLISIFYAYHYTRVSVIAFFTLYRLKNISVSCQIIKSLDLVRPEKNIGTVSWYCSFPNKTWLQLTANS